MRPPIRRFRFRLTFDAMLIVAAVALGCFAWTRAGSSAEAGVPAYDASIDTVAVGAVVDSSRWAAVASHGSVAAGKKSFSSRCVACHRPDGSGGIKLTGNPTPDWRDAKRMARRDDAYLRDCITNGKPKSGMPTWSKQGVKPAEIENLIAFVRTFSAGKK